MDQIKIGKFIQEMRKEKGMTQREIADELHISDKTVSKWETGNGLPEVSLMMPLCAVLGISVNELLSGERLEEREYQKSAEKNIIRLIEEKQRSKRNFVLSIIMGIGTVLTSVGIILLAGLLEIEEWQRILLVCIAFVTMATGVVAACVFDNEAGVFECRRCGERFVPDMRSYIMAPHTITTRKLRCPRCGKKSYCKKRFTE